MVVLEVLEYARPLLESSDAIVQALVLEFERVETRPRPESHVSRNGRRSRLPALRRSLRSAA
jgi:hypothetical protein